MIQAFDPATSPPSPPKRGLLSESGPLPGQTADASAPPAFNAPTAPSSSPPGFASGGWQPPENPAPRDYSGLRPVGGGVVGEGGQQVGVGNPQAGPGPASGGLVDPATLMELHDKAGYEQYRGGGIDAALGTVGANIAARARESQYVQQMNAWRQNQASTDRAAMEAMLGGSGAPAATPAAAPATPAAAGQPQPAVPARGFVRSPDQEQGPAARGLAAGATPAPAAAPQAAPPPQQAANDPNTLPMGQYNQYMQKQAQLARIYGASPDPAVRAKGLAIAQQIQQQQNPLVQAQLQRDYQKAGLDIQQEEANIQKAGTEKLGPWDKLVDLKSGKPVGGQGGSLGGVDTDAMFALPEGKARLDFVAKSNPALASNLQGWLSGNIPFDRARAGTNAPLFEQMLTSIDHNWTPNTAEQRRKIQEEINDPAKVGGVGWNQFAVNKSIEHLKSMWDMIDKLPNYQDGWGSSALNMGADAINSWNRDPTVTAFRSKANLAAPEVAKFVSGKAPAEGEVNKMEGDFDPRLGPTALKASILGKIELMRGNLGQLNDQVGRTMGSAADPNFSLLSPQSKAALAAMTGKDENGNPVNAAPPPAQNGPVQIKHDGDYNALPSGAHFIDPNGQERIKP